jgi:uncharacterized membrane protein
MHGLLKALRWFAAMAIALVGFVLAIGAVKAIRGMLPDSGVGSGVFYAVLAAAAVAGAYFLVRQDFRGLSRADVRRWFLTNPLGQAAVLYAAAAIVMIPLPKVSLVPGLLAQSAYAVTAPTASRRARRWWAHAALAVLGFVLLLVALAGTAEALTPRGFGEAGMVFLLPPGAEAGHQERGSRESDALIRRTPDGSCAAPRRPSEAVATRRRFAVGSAS